MVIPKEKVSQIRQSVDIVEIISESVLLRKTGKSFIGLCPFHAEKTPSFTVSPDKQRFHCFGCGEGGDAITFVMKHEGISFMDAVRRLAQKCGIDIEEKHGRRDPAYELRRSILEINRLASDFYAEMLRKHECAERARAYLVKRGISKQTVDDFHLGYAPDQWEALLSHLRRNRVDVSIAEKAGLVVPREKSSGHYDRFRNRLMFPILDIHGETVGLGGRVLDDSKPKYLNSPETPVYQKARNLYGFNKARNACRKAGEVFVTEGYMDLIAMHVHGFENTVATLGTAMTVDHIRMLKGVAERIVLMYDSDAAGIKAAKRCIELFKTEKRFEDIRILILPQDQDPDSFLREFGPDAMREHIENSLGVFSFLIETSVRQHGLSPQGKVKVIESLIEPIAAIEAFDSLTRLTAIRELADKTGIPETTIQDRIRQTPEQIRPGAKPLSRTPIELNRLERYLAMMVLHFPDAIPELKQSQWMGKLEDPVLNRIVCKACAQYNGSDRQRNLNDVVGLLLEDAESSDEKRLITELSMSTEVWDQAACKKLILQYTIRRRHEIHAAWMQKIRFAETSHDRIVLQKTLEDAQSALISTGGTDP
ncbi:DNA primase [Desulfatirhabdium butyrativorans]|uniref:DNA primase n=1 Tax=Desulfatirhabdium butyrativorans TaxID=340467 RepID=UPI00041A7AB7|nr:DNA primase [Desulfatirhabdium butyrativorans]